MTEQPKLNVVDEHGKPVDMANITILTKGNGVPFSAVSREEAKTDLPMIAMNRHERRRLLTLRKKEAARGRHAKPSAAHAD